MIKLPTLRRLAANNSGVALIEFALVMPLLLVLFIGTVEFGRLAIIQIKLDKAANTMADLVTQGTSVTQEQLNDFAGILPQIMQPFNYSGSVVFSSVVQTSVPIPPCDGTGSLSCITWQHKATPSGPDSRIGAPADNATLPGGYDVHPAENVIVAEIFFNYAPMINATAYFVPSLQAQQLYKIAVFKPRQGTLTTPPP